MQNVNPGGNPPARISSKEFGAKYRSKREIYNFLACDVGVFLPPYDNVTIYFLKDLMAGRKKMISTKMVKTIHIPQYEGLGVKEILRFLDDNHPNIFIYLPEREIELPKTPKQWIGNVISSMLGDRFNSWVQQQVNLRHDKVADKKDLMIQMDPDIAKVFLESKAVSSTFSSFHPFSIDDFLFFVSKSSSMLRI